MLLGKLFSWVRQNFDHRSVARRTLKRLWRSHAGRLLWNALWNVELEIRSRLTKQRLKDTVFIDPNRIQYDVIETYFDPHQDKGKIVGGDWDLPRNPVKFAMDTDVDPMDYARYHNVEVYQGLYERFIEGRDWKETEFFTRCIRRLDEGQVLYGFCAANRDELDAKCSEMDNLWNSINQHGYRLQREVGGYAEDEVSVVIARNGEFLFNDGIHRLCIAKLLDLETIPVEITVRHKEWHNFRQRILSRSLNGKVYQPLIHPDLSHIPSVYEYEERWKLIEENLSAKQGTMLDIGAEWGHFCHNFEKLGFNCVAVEANPDDLYFLEGLRIAEGRRFTIVGKSIFEYAEMEEELDVDVVLALNILHWFMRERELYDQCIGLLRKLNTREMFMQVPKKVSESEQRNPYMDYTDTEMVDFVLSHSRTLNRAEAIGEANGRPIYRLWQERT